MKVRDVLIYIVLVLMGLLFISITFPSKGIYILPSFKLQFTSLNELLENKNQYADLDDVLKRNIDIDSLLNIYFNRKEENALIIDSDVLKKTIQGIEYGENGVKDLYPFLEKLKRLRSGGNLIRVMHYGDSQIECDRITSFLRFKLQNQFGGTGIGLMPIVQAFDYNFALNVIPSSNWLRFTTLGKKDTQITHNNYGLLGSFCRFAPVKNDSLPSDSIEYSAHISIEPSAFGYNTAKRFKQIRLLFSGNTAPVRIKISEDGVVLFNDTLQIKNDRVGMRRWVFDTYKTHIKIEFYGYDSPDIYAIAIDDVSGIAVDNIALRGSSGTFFTHIDYNNLMASFHYVNTELFLLQFGGNVLPYLTSEKSCVDYAQSFYAQLKRLKSIKPNACIIVVGPGDKSIKEKDKFVSYPLIETLIDEMKKATFKANCAYWDIYKAMGGKNSMPSWVNANLAGKDYIHFSSEGAVIIANMLYNALIFEYNEYLKYTNNQEKNKKHDLTINDDEITL